MWHRLMRFFDWASEAQMGIADKFYWFLRDCADWCYEKGGGN